MGSGAGFSLSPIEKTPNIKILVGASDIDADVVRGTIRGLDGNCISQMLAGCQCLNLKVVVVQGVRPVPIRIDRQRAKISLERIGVVVSNEARNLSCIGVRNGKRTSVGQMKVLSYRSAIVASNAASAELGGCILLCHNFSYISSGRGEIVPSSWTKKCVDQQTYYPARGISDLSAPNLLRFPLHGRRFWVRHLQPIGRPLPYWL